MPTTGNLGFEAPPMAPPPSQPVAIETFADAAQKNSDKAQVPPVYYGGKTGTTAFYADKLLTGWLAGTKMAQERKAKKMADEVGAAKTGLDYIGQAYRAAVESGDQKKIQETQAALHEAYNDYLNKAEQYAIPEADGKKKGVGGKIKEGLKKFAQGGENPHLNIAHSTLEIMRKTDPTQLYGPSKQEQQQSKVLDMQVGEMEKNQKNQTRWEDLHQKDPKQWTAADKQFNDFYEYEKFGKTKEQQTKDDLLTKITGGEQLKPQEKQLAETLGLIKPDQTTAQIRTVQGKNGQPVSQIVPVTVTPDGKVTAGTPINLPGNDYVGPNQAQLAGQVVNAQMSALMKWGAKAHPEWDQNTPQGKQALTTWALSTLYPPTAGTINWADKNAQMDVMNRALNTVIGKHRKEYKDTDTGAPSTKLDEIGNAVMGNIVTATDDGRYIYMPSLSAPQTSGGSTWYKPWSWGSQPTESWSGLNREQLNSYERQFQAELRAELKKQNPKMADSQIDAMMPPMLSRAQAQSGGQMQPPPNAPSAPQSMQPPPQQRGTGGVTGAINYGQQGGQQGGEWYRVTLPDGSVAIRQMSSEYVEALKARGVQVAPYQYQ